MFSSVMSGLITGADCMLIRVEVDISSGLPSYMMVGCLASEVRESRDRVATALKNSGILLKPSRVTVNLSPADCRKKGTAFDLPIAAAMMSVTGYIPADALDGALLVGELGLDGSVCGTRGILSLVYEAKRAGMKRCIVPETNYAEAAVIKGIEIIAIRSLAELVDFFQGKIRKAQPLIFADQVPDEIIRPGSSDTGDFGEILGQEGLKRALQIAVAGFHHILLVGPPGVGKSMAASCIGSILPPMSFEESIEVSRIYSIAGLLGNHGGLVTKRPFRQPHHSISVQAMVGGGAVPVPGEISLAHNGVLFLDELGEYNPTLIEMLRQPLEARKIIINRVQASYTFPSNFMLVAAMNPCPCGYYPDRERCGCTQAKIRHYLRHVSLPILDRFDMGFEVQSADHQFSKAQQQCKNSEQMRSEIERARQMAKERFEAETFSFNAQIPSDRIKTFIRMDHEAEEMLQEICCDKKISMRGRNKILRVARTIADLQGSEIVMAHHMAEAIGFRSIDEKYWRGELWG